MCVGVHEDWLFYLLFQISLKNTRGALLPLQLHGPQTLI